MSSMYAAEPTLTWMLSRVRLQASSKRPRKACGEGNYLGQASFSHHCQNINVEAKATAERTTFGHLS